MIERSQELIDRLRHEFNLSINEVSDDKLWQMSKDTFMCARIDLRMKLNDLKKEIYKAFGIPKKYLGKNK